MPTFIYPAAFWGLTVILGLAAIYFFRSKAQPRVVSSLMLWLEQQKPVEGGITFKNFQFPLILLLEVLIVALIVVAMASPIIFAGEAGIPIVVVLDDSFSMLAGAENCARLRAIEVVQDQLNVEKRFYARFIIAGRNAEFMGVTARDLQEVKSVLTAWKCRSASSNLHEGITLAVESSKESPRIMVLTDHSPPAGFSDNRVRWLAFGKSSSNTAIVNASRSRFDERDRGFLEIANLSSQPAKITGAVKALSSGKIIQDLLVEMEPHGNRRFIFNIDDPAETIEAVIGSDALDIDNEIVLAPNRKKAVRCSLRLQNDKLRSLVEKAVTAAGADLTSSSEYDLILTDQSDFIASSSSEWVTEFVSESPALAFTEPFAMDRRHPLTDGLSLEGTVWGAGNEENFSGVPVIIVGNVPLVTEAKEPAGGKRIRIRFCCDLSTLPNSPDWPIFFWNLLQWRESRKPGPLVANLRLGTDARIYTKSGNRKLEILNVDGTTFKPVHQGEIFSFYPSEVGITRIKTDDESYAIAVNALTRDESDLSHLETGNWGDWMAFEPFRLEAIDVKWAFLIPALAILVFHMAMISPKAVRGRE